MSLKSVSTHTCIHAHIKVWTGRCEGGFLYKHSFLFGALPHRSNTTVEAVVQNELDISQMLQWITNCGDTALLQVSHPHENGWLCSFITHVNNRWSIVTVVAWSACYSKPALQRAGS